jgi:ABC-type sugar transport system permease subunit
MMETTQSPPYRAEGQTRSPSRPRKPLIEVLAPYLFVTPALLALMIFVFYPLVRSIHISFFQWNLVNPRQTFVGLENYVDLFTSPRFAELIQHSLLYIGLALIGVFLVPIGLALLAFRLSDHMVDIFQSAYFLPTVLATNIAMIIWTFFYQETGGLFNGVLELFGLDGLNWLKDTVWALPAVSLAANWKVMGFHFLIALAGLKAIPRDFIEAALVDGAGGWVLVRRIILPLFTPTLLFIFVITMVGAMDAVFVPIQVMTQGGPAGGTNNLMYAIYQDGFQYFRAGNASAISVVLIVCLGGLIYWQYRLLDRNVQYER